MGLAGTSGDQAGAGRTATAEPNSPKFLSASSPRQRDILGLNPVPQVRVHSGSPKKKKPTALDKQYRYVAALERRNRERAAAKEEEQKQQQAEQQLLAGFSQQLRSTILAGDFDTLQQSWQPVAAAAQLRQLQETAAQQTQQTLARLSAGSSPARSATSRGSSPAKQRSELGQTDSSRAADSPNLSTAAVASATDADDDVDDFLDSLIEQATALKQQTPSGSPVAPRSPSPAAAAGQLGTPPAGSTSPRPSTAKSSSSKQHSRLKPKPAWAISEQQQAESADAAEQVEEEHLLDFADNLDWQDLIGQLDDEQLAAAFKELEVAEAAAEDGDPSTDKHWRQSFVTALNSAAMHNIAATSGSQHNDSDRHSDAPSSASAIRRAEEKSTRRQKLLDRLSRLQNGSSGFVAGGSVKGPGSVAGDQASMFGGSVASLGGAGAAAAADNWDGSVGASDMKAVQQQIKVLEAEEVMSENPEMKGVHSLASIKTLLQKAESQQQ